MELALVVMEQGKRSLNARHATARVLTQEHAVHATGLGTLRDLKSHVFPVKAVDATTEDYVIGVVVAVYSSQQLKRVVIGATEQAHFLRHVENAMDVVSLNLHAENAVEQDGIAFKSTLKMRKNNFTQIACMHSTK